MAALACGNSSRQAGQSPGLAASSPAAAASSSSVTAQLADHQGGRGVPALDGGRDPQQVVPHVRDELVVEPGV